MLPGKVVKIEVGSFVLKVVNKIGVLSVEIAIVAGLLWESLDKVESCALIVNTPLEIVLWSIDVVFVVGLDCA